MPKIALIPLLPLKKGIIAQSHPCQGLSLAFKHFNYDFSDNLYGKPEIGMIVSNLSQLPGVSSDLS